MISFRRKDEIYHKEGGWFAANWHFSFDEYFDPQNMGFGTLRVFNDDRLVPGAVWPMHPHRDIEGLTYVVEGTFKHADSLGNGGVLPAGSVQRMTLGSGAYHSEQNGSQTEPIRFIQMWIMPRERGLPRRWSRRCSRGRTAPTSSCRSSRRTAHPVSACTRTHRSTYRGWRRAVRWSTSSSAASGPTSS